MAATTKPAAKTAKKPAAKKPAAKKTVDKAAAVRTASGATKAAHLQTRKKATDVKPNKIQNAIKSIKMTEGQEKFIWEKAEPVSGTNQAIYRRDVAGAIIKINEYGLESEFGWQYALVDPTGEYDDVNNITALHWMNAKVKRKNGEPWMANVTGSRDTKDIYNFQKETKIVPNAMDKLRKTNLFQPSVVERKKINVLIRKEPKK